MLIPFGWYFPTLCLVWNNHGRIPKTTAEAHIHEFLSLTPPVTVATPYANEITSNPPEEETSRPDLVTQDELNFRSLILGATHRAAGEFGPSRQFLVKAATENINDVEGKWIVPLAYFELAVLELQEIRALEVQDNAPSSSGGLKARWLTALRLASEHLDKSTASLGDTDLSSRLDARIPMVRISLRPPRILRSYDKLYS